MKQHFVPQVYLRPFARKIKRYHSLDVYDKKEQKFIKVKTENILAITNLYTLETPNEISENPLIIEKVYAQFIEPLYGKIYRILIDDNKTIISDQERAEIIIGILHLYYRNPHNFDRIINRHVLNIENIYKIALENNQNSFSYIDEIFEVKEYDLNSIKSKIKEKLDHYFKNHLELTTKFTQNHEFMIIEVFKSEKANLFTNDNPLYHQDYLVDDTSNPLLFSSEFTIPINKKYFVKLSHNKEKKNNFIYRSKISDFMVNVINNDIFNQAVRFVICNQDNYNEYIEIKMNLDDTSIHRKMDFIEGIILTCEQSNQKDEFYYLLKEFFSKYVSQDKNLSKEDEYHLMMKMKELNKKKKLNEI